jgi:hypothetical protein
MDISADEIRSHDEIIAIRQADYVRTCVTNKQIPGKFRADQDLLASGIVFDSNKRFLDYEETGVPISLPPGYKLKGIGNCLRLQSKEGSVVFTIRVAETGGGPLWYKTPS